jgi:hypothetical protein
MRPFDFTKTENWNVQTGSLFTDTDSEFARSLLSGFYATLDQLGATKDPESLQHAWRVLLTHMRERLANDPQISSFLDDERFLHDAWGVALAAEDFL